MELKQVRSIVMSSVVLLSPVALVAQVYQDSTMPGQQQQPMQQQQHPGGHSTPQTTNNDSNATPGLTGQEMKDKIFLRKSTEGSIAEIKMGQLAADKGSTEDVKALGSKMVADHTQLSSQMKPVADAMGIRLPKDMSKEDKAEYERLAALSGEAFDKAYILAMLQDHRKDFRAFHEEMMSTNDEALKDEIEKGEGIIREHMRMVVKMAKDRNILPMRPPTPPATPPPA